MDEYIFALIFENFNSIIENRNGMRKLINCGQYR